MRHAQIQKPSPKEKKNDELSCLQWDIKTCKCLWCSGFEGISFLPPNTASPSALGMPAEQESQKRGKGRKRPPDTKRMGVSMQNLCPLPGTVQPTSCWGREDENWNGALRNFCWLLRALERELQSQLWEQGKAASSMVWPAGPWEAHSQPILFKMSGQKCKNVTNCPVKLSNETLSWEMAFSFSLDCKIKAL